MYTPLFKLPIPSRHARVLVPPIFIVAALIAFLPATPAGADPPFFMGLGYLPGDSDSQALGISADGSVVVGYSQPDPSHKHAFQWTRAGGMVGLGFVPGGGFNGFSFATAASANGSVIVGESTGAGGPQAFRRTQASGMVGLGFLPADRSSVANGVSADGSIVVGTSADSSGSSEEAFLWTQQSGMVDIGRLPGRSESASTGVSADGTVVVGYSDSDAFRWTQQQGIVDLGRPPDGISSQSTGISSDGAVIIGVGTYASGHWEAVRWTESAGIIGLGHLPGGTDSLAFGVSADGSVIVGNNFDGLNGVDSAFLWKQDTGMRSLRDILVNELGLDLTGWELVVAQGISADGLTIVGWGYAPSGYDGAWIAHIPEPVTALLLITAASIFRRCRSSRPTPV